MPSLRVTIGFDNQSSCPEEARGPWGFAAWIESDQQHLLFDTGSNGRILLGNLERQGLPTSSLDGVFLSHSHWDHVGGLDSILELAPGAQVYLPLGFSRFQREDLEVSSGGVVRIGTEPREIAPGFWSTGSFPGNPPEQGLVVESPEGGLLLVGCSHPGVVTMAERAREILGRAPAWVVGGFHLFASSEEEVRSTIASLRQLGVERVVPTHCTGQDAREVFRTRFPEGFREGGVGSCFVIGGGP